MKADDEAIRRVFAQVNLAVAGEEMFTGLAAMKDMVAASACFGSKTLAEALDVARRFNSDLEATIRDNFEHYHSQRGETLNAPLASS